MDKLRRWLLDTNQPFALPLAADARLAATDYTDDQAWNLSLGAGAGPALALQTRYGGRVGLASLVPMWYAGGRSIYEAQGYAQPPAITGFAPGYICIQAALDPQLALQGEYWAIDSHTLGVRFTLSSAHTKPVTLHLDIFGHVGAEGKERKLGIIPLEGGGAALHMGRIGGINPAVLLEGGSAELVDGVPVSPKIGRDITVAGRRKTVLRWVHAGLPTAADSVAQAAHWLRQDWAPHLRRINQAAASIPDIQTGDETLDLILASAWNQLVLAFLRPTASLPHASLVALRGAAVGVSPRGDGTDQRREWSGQNPTWAYLAAQGIASVSPQLAQGIIRNYLAVQQPDGWIDWKPGLAGQRQGVLCLPVLARLAWGIFHYTEDDAFLREALPGLLKFFERWLSQDRDADGDGLPEWQTEHQTGYPFLPTFAAGQPWGQGLDIQTVEAPDLLAYLLSEAVSLRAAAYYLRQPDIEARMTAHIERLLAALETLWDAGAGCYRRRDRDTHRAAPGAVVLDGARGDEEQILALPVSPPNRLVVRVSGGVSHTPRLTLEISGLDASGQPVSETAAAAVFLWQHSYGVYTTRQVFAQVDRVRSDGLSRVYTVSARAADTTRLDIAALLPLWSAALPPERAEALTRLLSSPDHFWRPNGVTMCSAQDPAYDPANADGSGGVWPFWLTLLAEGLLETGRADLAAELLRRLLHAQASVFRETRAFAEFYHSDSARGLGEPAHLAGSVPLHLLLRVLGVQVISARKVWAGGPYHWGQPVTINQHGVSVRRSAGETAISFPSGGTVTLPAGAPWQEVTDPAAARPPRAASAAPDADSGQP